MHSSRSPLFLAYVLLLCLWVSATPTHALNTPSLLSADSFAQMAYAKASNTDMGDQFGYAVAVDGDTVVIGAPYEDSAATGVNGDQSDNNASNSGAVYVFVRNENAWIQQAYLKASNTNSADQFGYAVAVSEDTIIVGAIGEDSAATGFNGNQADNSAPNAGAAYVFIRDGEAWTQQAYLKAPLSIEGDQFGWSVAIDGETVIVGSPTEQMEYTGAAYVYLRTGETWAQQATLRATNKGYGDQFGYSVAISGETVIVGAPHEDSNALGIDGNGSNNSASSAGAVYTFVRNGSTWTQQAYLKASNTNPFDYFGVAVDVDGETVIIGANGEDSNARSVNGDQNNNSAPASGAAYVFTRAGVAWSQQAYLKASNTDEYDYFAHSVAVTGETVVIGAYGEDSPLISDEMSNSASSSGAGYRFSRNSGVWTQQAYLKASNVNADDEFGKALAADGNQFIVGAMREDSIALGINGHQTSNTASDSGAAYFLLSLADTLLLEWSTAVSSGAESVSAVTEPTLLVQGNILNDQTVELALMPNTATPGSDYTQAAPTIAIPAGTYDTPQAILIPPSALTILDDTEVEWEESLFLTLQNPSEGLVFADLDGDGAAHVAMEYLILIDETATLTLHDATIEEGDEGVSMLTFDLMLDRDLPEALDIPLTVQNGTARLGEDIGDRMSSVTLTGDHNETAHYSVEVYGDTSVEADETFSVYAIATLNPILSVNNAATGTILNDDDATVSLLADDGFAYESPTESGEFTVTMSAINGIGEPITVYFSVSGTATAGSDYASMGASVVIADGESSAVMTVTPFDDAFSESEETVIITLTGTDHPDVVLGSPLQAIVSIVSDETVTVTLNELELLASMREALPADADGLELLLIHITPESTLATLRLPDGTVSTAELLITLNDGLLTVIVSDLQAAENSFATVANSKLTGAFVSALNTAFEQSELAPKRIQSLTITNGALIFTMLP